MGEKQDTPGQNSEEQNTPKHRQDLTAVLTDPYVRQLKRECGPFMTPSEALAGPSSKVNIDLDYHTYQAQKACHEEQRPETVAFVLDILYSTSIVLLKK